MTLRHRLLLVYGIVVLLSVATVSTAIYELNRTQNIYGPLQIWHEVVRDTQQLKSKFPPPEPILPDDEDPILKLIAQDIGLNLVRASDYLDVDVVRGYYLFRVRSSYLNWKTATENNRAELTEQVNEAIGALTDIVEGELERLTEDARQQQTRKWTLLVAAICLGVLHVVVIGWLLRRWLLWPMERLSRQVEALGKDQPSPEPLLTSPLELARLAAALDRARQSLQVYRQQLIENERLTTIGQFAAQLAHNLRNPLASIRAVAQVTGRHERGNNYVCERMNEVVACVDRLNHWIAGLMEVARREPTPTGCGDVTPLLHRIHEALRSELAVKELTLAVDAPSEGLVCAHDPATLEQALIAMVVNAIEASPLGRSITLRAERIEGSGFRAQDQSPERERGVGEWRGRGGEEERGGQGDKETRGQGDDGAAAQSEIRNPKSEITLVCRISVNDEGPGLPADDPERIFEFSYSTKQKGMGLGLALARLTLERQGGEAHACNRAEGGAMVYVDLPLGESEK